MWKIPWPQCSLAEPGSQHHHHLLDRRFPLNADLKIRTLHSLLLSLAKRFQSAWRVWEIPLVMQWKEGVWVLPLTLSKPTLLDLRLSISETESRTIRRRREEVERIVHRFIDPYIPFVVEGFSRMNGAPDSTVSTNYKTRTNNKHPQTV